MGWGTVAIQKRQLIGNTGQLHKALRFIYIIKETGWGGLGTRREKYRFKVTDAFYKAVTQNTHSCPAEIPLGQG